jgi:hypothetical protein
MAPWAIALYVWCTSRSLRNAWAPMLVTTLVAVPVVFFVLLFWAGAHQCFE